MLTASFTGCALRVLVGQNLNRSDDQGLMLGRSNASTSLAFCWSSDYGFVGLNQAGQMAAVLVGHSLAQPVQPLPGRGVAR